MLESDCHAGREIPIDTGRKILNLRKDLGVPQKDLAVQSSITPSALSRIEAGKHLPKGPVALQLARHLGVTVEYLLDDSAPYPPPPHQLLEQLALRRSAEGRDQQISVSARELTLLEALRGLDHDRLLLLQTVLSSPQDRVRRAALLLGVGEQLAGGVTAQERAAAGS